MNPFIPELHSLFNDTAKKSNQKYLLAFHEFLPFKVI